jgi:hypothetical protein
MNIQAIISFLFVSTILLACADPPESWDMMDRYTSINQFSEVQSNETDQLIIPYLNHYTGSIIKVV